MEPTFDLATAREVDARARDGVEVRLLWHPPSDRVAVEVIDSRCGEHFALAIEGAYALDAFHHPFAYAAFERAATEHDTDLDPVHLREGREEVKT
jgi:hypothetical protein